MPMLGTWAKKTILAISLKAILLVALPVVAMSRELTPDFLDADSLIERINEYCGDFCFDVGSKYEDEWLVTKVIVSAEKADSTILVTVSETFGRHLPGRPDLFEATDTEVSYTVDMRFVRLRRHFGFGTVISLDVECPNANTPNCSRLKIFLSGNRPDVVGSMEWDLEVLAAVAKGWSHAKTYEHFCPPADPSASVGHHAFDWCEQATQFMSTNPQTDKALPTEPTEVGIEDPEAFALRELIDRCGTVEFFDGSHKRLDLTNDGLNDLIIEFRLLCGGSDLWFCKASGPCEDGYVFIQLANGRWQLSTLQPGFRTDVVYGQRMFLEPSTVCGPFGISDDRCETIRIWDGDQFAYTGTRLGSYVWIHKTGAHFRITDGEPVMLPPTSMEAFGDAQ